MKRASTAILLINTGSPDSPKIKDVSRYLRKFLTNSRVIDIPKIPRWLLVNLIIAPFRAPKSARLYKHIYGQNGFPLTYYGEKIKNKLQQLYTDADVFTAMSFGNPSLTNVLENIRRDNYRQIIILPLFPQYASSTTGACLEEAVDIIKKWTVIPQINTINHFFNSPYFINSFKKNIEKYNLRDYGHILFSYHGLPMAHLYKTCESENPAGCNCEKEFLVKSQYCYKAACYETSRLIAQSVNLKESDYSVAFQSRMGKNWMQPFTDRLIVAKARQGVKKILVISPSFVTDCLETTVEIGFEYKKLFQEAGGDVLTLVESLNDSDDWINALKNIIDS